MVDLITKPLEKALLVGFAVAMIASSEPRVGTVATESASIFLTAIERAQAGEGCTQFHLRKVGRCRTTVRARILRVFKGGYDRATSPETFEIEIQQAIGFSAISPWSDNTIETGQQYLIFSPRKEVSPSAFASTLGPILLTDQEDAVGDLELILNTEALTVHQQAVAVATAITGDRKPHSYFLSHYAAALLAAGSEAETGDLAQALEGSTENVFSEDAKTVLLSQLWAKARSVAMPPESLLRTYVLMTARYFLLPADKPTRDRPNLREEIMSRHLPWLLGSERTKAIMGTALSPVLAQQLRRQVQALATDERQRPERRRMLLELLPLIGSK